MAVVLMITNEIEKLRNKLHEYIDLNYDYEVIINLSQDLDRLISQYYFSLLKNKNDIKGIEN